MSFRMSDIRRISFEQRVLLEKGWGFCFVALPRNDHDLQREFPDGLPCCAKNPRMREVLNVLTLRVEVG
jgi:hypothetical protein